MTKMTLTNATDLDKVVEGLLRPDQVRRIELDSLVDTGAVTLAIPADAARALGVREIDRRRVRLANGSFEELPVVVNFIVEILGRRTACEAFVLPEGTTPLIGQIPLEALDLHVDPKSRDLIVNPLSPDMPLVDLLRAS